MTEYAIYPSLRDKPVFVTGGGSGIGESIVEHLCRQQARVFFVDINEEASTALVARLKAEGLAVPRFRRCDLRDIADLRAAVAEAQQAIGPIRVLINNAAHDQRHAPETVEPDYWDERMAVNLRHQFFAAQAVQPGMRDAGGGSIINFGSVSWRLRQGGMPAYTAAKAGVEGLTRGLARDWGPQHIRVNTVMPGWVITQRQKDLWLTPEADEERRKGQCIPDQVLPVHLAQMTLWLAADDSAMCTGQTFVVDAGWASGL
ncbi:SDR family oxidoreductase [Inquilinus limosus]|uniref:SDR family NAD(P)-dependent oxidoreductase n=1 Tax=Inquilinus limosus TaxID=171674 RepID=UPI003F17A478